MATPTSYLQTLSRNDAIAFIDSLQRVKSHLSGEIQWMHQQVQQKTVQLQGIETLISEAIELGLLTAEASSTDGSLSLPSVATEHLTTEDIISSVIESDESDEFDRVPNNGNGVLNPTSPGASSTAVSSSVPTLTPITAGATKAKSNRKNTKNSTPSKPKAQTASTNKTGSNKTKSSPAKKAGSSQRLASKVSKPSNTQELKNLLLPKFAGKTLTDAVAQILGEATKSLHLNDLLSQMYGDLSAQDFKRAKISLANVLSIGKKEGKWQNLGDGLYAANSVAK
ncbi:MAG: hypothetical protein NW224_17670 [Leptolyngbyaceae cyanobacterium bins.302]|nr:hypothetical protein [Leptolyngbyaceae cyanobacterium bins.302]